MLKKNANKDPEAALASMETLEDKLDPNNDGMENVKLDGDVSYYIIYFSSLSLECCF